MGEENLNVKEEKKKKTSVFKKKEVWISIVVGLVIGVLITYLLSFVGLPGLGRETIATFKGGKITKAGLYDEMKKFYHVTYVLESIDSQILADMYNLTEEQEEEVNTQADSLLDMYQTYYGMTEEEFLEENGFNSNEEFIDYLKLDYRRNLYCIDYFKTLIPQEDIQNYYDENVYGKINTKHMLVEISDDVTEKEALKLANEIIDKLNNGTSFDDVANEYSDQITTEDVSFTNFDENTIATEYVEATKNLENGKYTTSPVKTDFGYHVIYRTGQDDKPSYEDAENDIVEILGADLEAENEYIRDEALIKLREEKNLKFKDGKFKEQYEEYCKNVEESSTTSTDDTAE